MDIIVTALGEFVWTASYVLEFRIRFLSILFYFSCAVVNFSLSSGLSVLTVFVSLLCAILASAFYKYTTSREQMSIDDTTCPLVNQENDDLDKPITLTSITEPSITSTMTATNESTNIETIQSLSEIEITIEDVKESTTDYEENINENITDFEDNAIDDGGNNEEIANDIIIDTIEGTEEEIQKKQIANIYRLLNDQHLINNWTTTDFLDQLKMYGLEQYDESELESS
jgi:hypothetical protein